MSDGDRDARQTVGERRARLRRRRYDAALLLPNSFNAARLAWRAGIRERWGYRARFPIAAPHAGVSSPPTRVHQAEYYRHLVRRAGLSRRSPIAPRLELSDEHRAAGAALLAGSGWDGRTPLVAVAPGAAFGGAKRWPAASFAALVDGLVADGVRSVLVGSGRGSRRPATRWWRAAQARRAPINLVGRTDLPALAAVLSQCRALVTNDSGAMHFAAALGVNVIAMFGPTRERETRPIGTGRHAVLTHPVWCRPACCASVR